MQSFITVAREAALDAARQLDNRIAKEGTADLGPLAGVPLGIKVSPPLMASFRPEARLAERARQDGHVALQGSLSMHCSFFKML